MLDVIAVELQEPASLKGRSWSSCARLGRRASSRKRGLNEFTPNSRTLPLWWVLQVELGLSMWGSPQASICDLLCGLGGLLLVVVTTFGRLSSGPTTKESRRLWPILYLNLLRFPTPKNQDSGHAPHGHRAVSILGSSNWSCLASFCLSIAYADQPLCPDSQVTS